MAVTLFASGTQSTTGGGTEDFLSSPDEAGVFQVFIDLNDMVDGDVIEFFVYKKVLTGGTARVLYWDRREGAQPDTDKIIASVPVSNDLAESNAVRFSVKQLTGTASLPWAVLQHA